MNYLLNLLLFIGKFTSGKELSSAPLIFDPPSLVLHNFSPSKFFIWGKCHGCLYNRDLTPVLLGQVEFWVVFVFFFFNIYIHPYFLKPCAHREHRNLSVTKQLSLRSDRIRHPKIYHHPKINSFGIKIILG